MIAAILACAPVAGWGGAAGAGAIRHDTLDSAYTTAANAYTAVGHFSDFTGGTLVRLNTTDTSSLYVLTAAHIGLPGGGFTINGQTIAVVSRTVHPAFNLATIENDIAIVQLATAPTGVTPITIYTGNTEAGQSATIVGYGATGNGITGATNGTHGTKRAGTNVVDRYGFTIPAGNGASSGGIVQTTDNAAANYKLITDFDAPSDPSQYPDGTYPNQFGSATPLTTEYQVADRDSGGALILNIGGIDYLAGVTSQIVNGNGDSTGTGYSDWSIFTRVSSFQTFVAGNVPEPGSVALVGAFACALLGRSRRRPVR
ncbi:MAG: trypsin-like serine protease [Phycisphaerae bacterium]|nr:trypsin-like serine protease [Tepidisphaeraceae bacterium]